MDASRRGESNHLPKVYSQQIADMVILLLL